LGLLALGLCGAASNVRAQTPSPSPSPRPDLPPDEKDFLGLTSLALGSGARAFGMGGAFLARADDATAASWNPAGLSYLRRPELSLVGARNAFDRGPEGSTATDRLVGYTPDFMAVAYPFDIGGVSGAVQLSYQRIFSFRGTRTIDKTAFFFNTTGEGGFDVLALGTGLRLTRSLRVGGTLNRWLNGYHQHRVRTSLGGQRARGGTEQDIDYHLSGWNLNAGAIWSPVENLSVGGVAKTAFTGKLDLTRSRVDTFAAPANEVPPPPTTNAFGPLRGSLHLPGSFGIGLSWRPSSPLTLSADYTRTFWSRGQIRNFFVVPQTPSPEPGQEPERPDPEKFPDPLPYPTLNDEFQEDTEQLRIGGEYVIIGQRFKVPLRAGFFTDRQYFLDFTGRPPRFQGVTVGLGVATRSLLVDVAYVLEFGTYKDAEAMGAETFTRFHRFFVSLIYRHGAGP
jgi:long-subunit fatty acid transport protein